MGSRVSGIVNDMYCLSSMDVYLNHLIATSFVLLNQISQATQRLLECSLECTIYCLPQYDLFKIFESISSRASA